MKPDKRTPFIALLVFAIIIVPTVVVKAIGINVNIPGAQVSAAAANPCTTVINFYKFALLISGILAFGAIVWGGIKYAVSAGNPSGQSEGKDWIKGALLGILLLAGAYLILNIINPALVHCQMPVIQQLPASTAPPSGGTATCTPPCSGGQTCVATNTCQCVGTVCNGTCCPSPKICSYSTYQPTCQ